jgi:hypothetical protein
MRYADEVLVRMSGFVPFSVENRKLKANFHSGKLSVDWNGQENFSLC